MKIGIFGGSFNPPHRMHKNIAIELLNEKYLDKIIYVPAGNNYNKPGLLDVKDRVELINLMFADDIKAKIEVSSFEVDGSKYTYEVLQHFREKYPSDEIYFICGSDNLNEFDTWKKYEEILQNYKLLVIGRENNEYEEIMKKYAKYKNNIILTKLSPQLISAAMIRKEILKNGFTENLKEYLDVDVVEKLKQIDLNLYWK